MNINLKSTVDKHPIISSFLLIGSITAALIFSANWIQEQVPERLVYPEAVVKKQYSNREIKCLEDNIHFEASGEPFVGKLAVGKVTLNRARDKKANICDVVYESGQFEWTRKPLKNTVASQDTKLAVYMVLNNTIDLDHLDNLIYFHATRVNPKWSKVKQYILTIGNHKFYAERRD